MNKIFKTPELIFFKLYSKFLGIKEILKYYSQPIRRSKNFNKRIRIIFKSNKFFERKKIFIFVSYAKYLSESSKNYLKFLNDLGYGIIHVNNIKTSRDDLLFLKNLLSIVVDRVNIGRDFGGYKDAFLYLNSLGVLQNLKYLGFANDSVQFLPGKNAEQLKKSIFEFEESNDFALFTHKSYQVMPHYQSFFKILSNEVFNKNEYISFWSRYKPYDNKSHLIFKGEIELSKVFYNLINKIKILYSTTELSKKLINSSDNILKDSISDLMVSTILPSTAKNDFLKAFYDIKLKALLKNKKFQFEIFNLIENSNPSHSGAFLYPLLLDCPFIKNDLAVAGSFSIGQTAQLYQLCLICSLDLNNEICKNNYLKLISEYSDVLVKKGNPYSYKKRRIEYYNLGLF